MSSECKCKQCRFKYILEDFKLQSEKENCDVMDLYLKSLNGILQGWDGLKADDFFADCHSCEPKINLDSEVTKKFLSFYPGRTIIDIENIKNMSLKLKNLPNRDYHLSLKNVYKLYISKFIQNFTEDEVIYISIIYNSNFDSSNGIYLTYEERTAIQKIYMDLDHKLEMLRKENEDLKSELTHYHYMPGGPGYNDAKSEFEKHQKISRDDG